MPLPLPFWEYEKPGPLTKILVERASLKPDKAPTKQDGLDKKHLPKDVHLTDKQIAARAEFQAAIDRSEKSCRDRMIDKSVQVRRRLVKRQAPRHNFDIKPGRDLVSPVKHFTLGHGPDRIGK